MQQNWHCISKDVVSISSSTDKIFVPYTKSTGMSTKSGLFLTEFEPEQSHDPPQHSCSPQSPNGSTTFSVPVTTILHLHLNIHLHCCLLKLLIPSTTIFAREMLRMISPLLPISLAYTHCNVNVKLKVPFYLVLLYEALGVLFWY
jgi:hypothetical protein